MAPEATRGHHHRPFFCVQVGLDVATEPRGRGRGSDNFFRHRARSHTGWHSAQRGAMYYVGNSGPVGCHAATWSESDVDESTSVHDKVKELTHRTAKSRLDSRPTLPRTEQINKYRSSDPLALGSGPPTLRASYVRSTEMYCVRPGHACGL